LKKLLQTLEEAVQNTLQGKPLSATTLKKKRLQTLLKQTTVIATTIGSFHNKKNFPKKQRKITEKTT
jgi:hypothetical protein